MKCLFGRIENEEMILNEFGTVAYEEWLKLATRFSNFELDVFQIMPNHMHAIVVLNESPVVAGFTPAHSPFIEKNIQTEILNEIATDNAHKIVADNEIEILTSNEYDVPVNKERNVAAGNSTEIAAGKSTEIINVKKIFKPTNANLGNIIGAYKSLVAKHCLGLHKQKFSMLGGAGINIGLSIGAGLNPAPTLGKIWQRNYYEHIIRNERAYQNISNYIINNPAKWKGDKFYEK